MTVRPSVRVGNSSAAHRRNSADKGHDLYGVHRISQKQLHRLARRIAAREKDVLISLKLCRFLTTGQIQRLHFTEAVTYSARIRATNRLLSRLRDTGLLFSLPRRIGGMRAGSAAAIWNLTVAGQKFLCLSASQSCPRRRFYEPTTAFLEHSLAAAELYVRLKTDQEITCETIQLEPECWRGKLKPDLYAATISGEFVDYWFFEIDRNTEAPSRVIAKCRRYVDYYRSGLEQKNSEVFPLVVWLVPDEKRKTTLEHYIAGELGNFNRLFAVRVFDDELRFTA